MKKKIVLALLLTIPVAVMAQKKKNKKDLPAPVPAVAAAPAEKSDTLYHRKFQVSLQEVSHYEENRLPLVNGYAFLLKHGQKVRVEGSKDSTRTPYFVIGDKPATRQDIEALDAADLENIKLLKNLKATATYGDKAKNGAVIVRVKQPAVPN